jgi:hypothetical protein
MMTVATKTEIIDHVETVAAQPPAVIDQQQAMLSMIERVALNPEVPIERLERLLDMKERLDEKAREEGARQARMAYHRAKAACQAKLKVVVRASKNTHTGSTYADLAALAASADPIIHEHGFTTSFQPAGTAENGDILIRWEVAHEAGHIEEGVAAFPPDAAGSQGKANKTPIQAQGSTYSYGRRYLKLMLFDIATGDDNDGNANAAGRDTGTISPDQFRALRDLLEQSGSDEARFLRFFKIEMLEEMPVARFGEADKMLRQKIAEKGAGA